MITVKSYIISASRAEDSLTYIRSAIEDLRWVWPRLELASKRLEHVVKRSRELHKKSVDQSDGGELAELTDHARGNISTTISELRRALEAAIQAMTPGNYRVRIDITFEDHKGGNRAGEFPPPNPNAVWLNPHGEE